MKLLNSIKNFISKTDLKTFYIYLISYAATCVVLFGFIVFYYYYSVSGLQKNIRNINDYREQVLGIMEKFAIIKQQQAIVEEILTKDPDFKIAGYFKDLLSTLNLTDKKISDEISVADLEENYRKTELNTKFDGMTMQDLTRLLEELEKNPRVATDRLEITKKNRNQKTIEVNLTISTLLPKIEGTAT